MYDVIIVGSGPAGIGAAIYAKRAGKRIVVVEKNYGGVGQIAYSSRVDNYAGLYGINGYELGMKFRTHAKELGVEIIENEIVGFESQSDDEGILLWKTLMADGSYLESRTVIYAAGADYRKLGIPGEEEFTGRGVSYCATCDGAFFRNKKTAIVGGGDTALDDALYLSGICDTVYLIHRRESFRGAQSTVEKLKKCANVKMLLNTQPEKITGEAKVNKMVLSDGNTVDVDGVFIAVGMKPATDCLEGIVALDQSGYIIADETGETNAKGFFAAGDVRTKKLRQVITAVSDGANAAESAKAYLDRL